MNQRVIGLLLVAFLVMSFTAVGSEYYLIPKDSNVSIDDNVTEVEIWLNATVPVASGLVRVNYTYCCINITDYVANTTYFEDVATYKKDGQVNTAFAHWDDNTPENQPIGLYHIGNLTIECCDRDCTTNLSLIECELFDWFEYGPAGEIPFNVTNGSFTCNASDEPKDDEPCLGTCYADANCTDVVAHNVECCECVAEPGFRWHPNLDEACFGNNTPSDLCLDYCPECVDCDDNDEDNFTDYPMDPECTCGLDPSESEPRPPIPELPTIALAGLGILGIALIARKKE